MPPCCRPSAQADRAPRAPRWLQQERGAARLVPSGPHQGRLRRSHLLGSAAGSRPVTHAWGQQVAAVMRPSASRLADRSSRNQSSGADAYAESHGPGEVLEAPSGRRDSSGEITSRCSRAGGSPCAGA